MSSKPCVAEPAKSLALLPSGYTPRRKRGWVDLPCGKRCWFARVPKRDENLRNYIEIMDAFGRDIPKRFQYILFWEVDRFGTTQEPSTSSKSENPENRITAMFSTELTLRTYAAEIVHVYYNGDIPGAKYDSHSDPRTFFLTSGVYEVIVESRDEPLVVLPQPFFPVPSQVQNLPAQTTNTTGAATTARIPTTTHADAAPQIAFKPQTSNATRPRPMIQPNPTVQTPGEQTPNKKRTWSQVDAEGGGERTSTDNHR